MSAMPSVPEPVTEAKTDRQSKPAANPLDESITCLDDVASGMITKVRVAAVKETQLNVVLADNIQGRVDVSEIFDEWEEISNPKAPLQRFYENQIMRVRVLGTHDARTHTYLPVTHRSGHAVLELTAKPSSLRDEAELDPISMSKIEVGSSWIGFVNNHGSNCLWVSLSPTVRGRVYAMEASDDLFQVKDLETNFPIGCAMRVRVLAVDAEHHRLDLSARSPGSTDNLTWDTVKENMVLPGKVTKVNDRQVMVQLSKSLSGPVHLVDMSDNYDQVTTAPYSKHDVIRVSVVELDKSNKKIRLSTRPSRVLNSSLQVEDAEITRASKIEPGRKIRGFVKNVSDKGLFVNLGGDITGFVRIADLSDKYLKEWKTHFQIDQLTKGRVISVDPALGHIQLSLKASVVEEDYTPLLSLADLKVGQEVAGRVRKVEEFGAFIVVDNSANVSGLCHRSEMAEKPVKDARKLYKEGDIVKAKVLAIDREKRRINLGLKPCYFDEEDGDDMDVDPSKGREASVLSDAESEDLDEDVQDIGGALLITGTDNAEESEEDLDSDVDMTDQTPGLAEGLSAGGFDWSGGALDEGVDEVQSQVDGEPAAVQKKKRRRNVDDLVDRTGTLDAQGPQSASDYERLLLGQPDNSSLWIAYVAFQMRVGELGKAREVAERAIKTINLREEDEKLNIWIAYVNLEVAYGSDETLENVFKSACEHNDEQEVYERVASIYIQCGKTKVGPLDPGRFARAGTC